MYSIAGTSWDILRTFLVIGVIIFVHELGHFLAAKKVGIKVERFSIGFGPKLIGFQRGDTEYCISWFPIFGGYVKMAGENPAEEPDEEGEERKGQFLAAPVSHRAIVALAGPVMNMVLAVFVVALAYMAGLPSPLGTTIGDVQPNSPASEAGIQSGDRILSIGGYKVRTWDDVRENIAMKPDEEIEIALLRNDNEEITLKAIPERIKGLAFSIKPEFSIGSDFQNELDSNVISEDLEQELESDGVLLSPDAEVLIEETGSRWLIVDKDGKYPVRKEDNKLSVYREIEFVGFQSDLDRGVISKDLRREFENNDISLSQNVNTLAEEAGSSWLVTDGDKKYTVRKEKDELNVYGETEYGMIGILPSIDLVIGGVESGSAAAEVGLHVGDVIEAVNGTSVGHAAELVGELQEIPNETVVLTVRRGKDIIETPIAMDFDENGELVSLGGLSFGRTVHLNPIAAFAAAVPETARLGGKIFQILRRLTIVRDISPKHLAGPVGIVRITMAFMKTGTARVLWFAGFLSINLGIVNLLPLFITDGGIIVFLIVEKLRGKRMSHRKQLLVQQIGIGFILFLLLFLTYNDILQWIKGPF